MSKDEKQVAGFAGEIPLVVDVPSVISLPSNAKREKRWYPEGWLRGKICLEGGFIVMRQVHVSAQKRVCNQHNFSCKAAAGEAKPD